MQVTLLFFAAARDVTGCSKLVVDLPESVRDVSELLAWLGETYDALLPYLPCLRIAQNEQFADGTSILEPGDVLAVIPPVAGG
jgi:molybdopterin converting factor subunit 1